MGNNVDLLKSAPQFDVHKWSEYSEVDAVVDAIFDEIRDLRKSKDIQVRRADRVKRSIKVLIIDLWSACKLSLNPYRGISKNKSDYQNESRYRKIFLKYDFLIATLNDLRDLKYIEEKLGYRFKGVDSKRTRIRATNKLINKIVSAEYGLNNKVENDGAISFVKNISDDETIVLKDTDGNLIDYKDDDSTQRMRENLLKLNKKLSDTRISLHISDEQHQNIMERLKQKDEDRPTIDFTNVMLHRVFNNSSWTLGGRFYGGWWQNIPKEFRKYIDINHKPTVELDYSGHHIRMLYATDGFSPPEDPYDLSEFEREDQKQAILIMLNASNEEKALKAMANKGIKNTKDISNAITQRHSQIQHHFFTGVGLNLMYQDSLIAEIIMMRMLDNGAVVLPVHDSFIVRNSLSNELEEMMLIVFEEVYSQMASLKPKITMLEQYQIDRETKGLKQDFVTDDLEQIVLNRINNYSWYRSIWGG